MATTTATAAMTFLPCCCQNTSGSNCCRNSKSCLVDSATVIPLKVRAFSTKSTKTQAVNFPCQKPQKSHVFHQVAAPHPPRLLSQPIQPLQPASLHPPRRALDKSGHHVKRPAHAHHERHLQLVLPALQKNLLLR